MKSLVAVAALGLVFPGCAFAHQTYGTVTVAAQGDAEQLIGILVSQDSILDLGARAFDYGVNQGDVVDPAARKLYDANPGMKEYVADKVRPEFRAILIRELPKLQHDLTGIVIAEMTPAEIADTLAFFASPTGVKMKAQIFQTIGDKPDQSQAEMQQKAIAAAMASLTPEDYPALMAFGGSTAAQKMQAVTPKISAASEGWANQMIAAHQARLKQVAKGAQAEFLSRNKGAEARP